MRTHHSPRARIIVLATLAVTVAAVAGCRPLPPRPPKPLAPQPPPENRLPRPTLTVDQGFVAASRPWDLAFDPVGARELVFTENNTGLVRVRRNTGSVVNVADMNAALGGAFHHDGEGGLMGIAFNPSGSAIYVCTSTVNDNRVVRFGVVRNGAGQITGLGAPANVVTGMTRAGFHNGCRVRFQPGTSPPALWVTMGDAGVGPLPQNPASLNGKVLRVLENGAAYPGNASGARWFTKGHRNPQGIAFRPGINTPYEAEHGPDRDDEVNALHNGANSGWNPTNGSDYDQTKPMTDIAKYPGVLRPVWRSGTPGSAVTYAPSGLTFLVGPQWKAWSGALVVAFLKNRELRVLFLDQPGFVTGQLTVPESKLGKRLRVPVLGPGGALYVATDEDPGAIWKITAS